jgi:hypothetical protein
MGGGAVFGGSYFGGRGRASHMRHVGQLNGYPEDWMSSTKKTIETELKSRGIEPSVIEAVVSKVEEQPMLAPILAAIFGTALVCTLIFVVIWESTP